MTAEELERLKAQVRMTLVGDKVTIDKRIKAEIVLLRGHARIFEDKPGFFECEASFGKGIADQKESTLFDMVTNETIRWLF